MAALFSAFAGKRAGCVDKRNDRDTEFAGHPHQTNGFAVAFGSGHAKIALDPAFGVRTFFMADDHDRTVIQPCQAANHRVIIGKIPVPCERRELSEKPVNVVQAMGTFGVTRDLTFAPRCEVLVKVA